MVKLSDSLRHIITEQWLVDFLEQLDIPSDPSLIDEAMMAKIRNDALIEKISDAEMANIGKRSSVTIKSLDMFDVAVLLYVMFPFKNVKLGDSNVTGTFMVYVPTNTGIWASGSGKHGKQGTYTRDQSILYKLPYVMGIRKTRDIKDCLEMIERLSDSVESCNESHLTAVGNGIYNNKTKELQPFTPDIVMTSKIVVDYVKDAPKPIITMPDGVDWDYDSWQHDIANNDDEIDQLLWQVMSRSMYPQNNSGKSVWLYSILGNNGKGTWGQVIKNLVGLGNYSSLSVDDFSHDHALETLIGVSVNIADENNVDKYIDAVRQFKATITGDDITVNIKYQKAIRMQFKGMNIQMMNGLPKTKDKTDSFYRRLIIVPFMKSFTNNGERRYIKSDYIHRKDVLEYVLSKALPMEFDEFIVPQATKQVLSEYREKNSPVIEFWNEFKGSFKWDLLPTQFLYDLYKAWFKDTSPSGVVVGRGSFIDQLRSVVESDGEWDDFMSSNMSAKSSKGVMDADEPLITDYNLIGWMNTSSKTSDVKTVRDFPRKAVYRGLLRK